MDGKPEQGELWRRKAKTLPPHYNMTLLERPEDELRELAYLRTVTEEIVGWRRDAEDKPALHLLPRAQFLRSFDRVLPVRPSPPSIDSSATAESTG